MKSERVTSDRWVAGVAIERVVAQSRRVLVEIMHNPVGIETAELRRKMDANVYTEKICVCFLSWAKISRKHGEFWRIAFWIHRLHPLCSARMRASVFTP